MFRLLHNFDHPKFYTDSYGTAIAYGNKDYLIWSLLFLIIVAIAITHIVEEKKKIRFLNVNAAGITLIGLVGAIYYLAKVIESIVDGTITYLGIAITILFLLLISLGVVMIFEQKSVTK